MNIGILGFAHGHVNTYCKAWLADEAHGIRVTVGWDRDAKRLARAVETHGLTPCDSAAAVLDADIDAVVIASETCFHAELVEAAAAAGKAIVLQKPMALTMAEGDRIVQAVARTGVPFTMAWQMRVDPQNLKMRELVQSGVLGRIFMVRRRHCLDFCLKPANAGSWNLNPTYNRDIWADDAAHPIDFMLWMFGKPVSVTAELATLFNPAIPNDNGIAIFRYADGLIAEVSCSFVALAGENTTEIVGERGVVIQNYGDAVSASAPRNEQAVGLKWKMADEPDWTVSELVSPRSQGVRIATLAGPLAEFMQGKRPPLATAEEGCTALSLVLATYDANAAGRRVQLG